MKNDRLTIPDLHLVSKIIDPPHSVRHGVRCGKLASATARAPLSNVIITIAVSSSPDVLKSGVTSASAVAYTSTG
jgi:hypothetical protein